MKKLILFSLLAAFFCAMSPCVSSGQSIPAEEGWKDAKFPLIRRTVVGENEVFLIALKRNDLPTVIFLAQTDEEKAALKETYPERKIAATLNVMLIKGKGIDGEKSVILVDTGLPDSVESLLTALKECGVGPEDVKFVLLTHGHPDHIGGLLKRGQPTFPQAALVICDQEFHFWMNNANQDKVPDLTRGTFPLFQKNLNAYEERIVLVHSEALTSRTEDGAPGAVSFFPGVQVLAAFGHTPGHVVVRMESEKGTLLFWGDLLHAFAYQTKMPQVSPRFDGDPYMAAQTRAQWLKTAREKGYYCTGVHVPGPFTWQLP